MHRGGGAGAVSFRNSWYDLVMALEGKGEGRTRGIMHAQGGGQVTVGMPLWQPATQSNASASSRLPLFPPTHEYVGGQQVVVDGGDLGGVTAW